MPQIHLHAERAITPVVILPGDRSVRRRSRRFDGGLEPRARSTNGASSATGTVNGVPVSVQVAMMGSPTTGIVIEELLMLGVTALAGRDDGGVRRG
jgi:uridine phosphorylase